MPNGFALGRARALQITATDKGIFTILAIDHRDALRVLVEPTAPATVPAARLTEIKLDVVKDLASLASAVLLDPVYGAAQAIAAGVLPGRVGLLCSLEEQGYLGNPDGRQTSLLTGWSVEKAKRLGANGVKILLLYHPDSAAAPVQQEFVRAVLRECERYEIPLFLEPISYALNPDTPKGSAEFAKERRRIVIESVKRLGALRPDVLKVEFPVDVKNQPDEGLWRDACAELNDASPVPWALLSADEPFEVFQRQLRVACESGCSGFVAGRAVWREAATLPHAERAPFLETEAANRFRSLSEIAAAFGKPWSAREPRLAVDETWYQTY